MERPPLEVADLVRAAGQGFLVRSRKWLRGQHLKVLSAIARCRTAALGGHRLRCDKVRLVRRPSRGAQRVARSRPRMRNVEVEALPRKPRMRSSHVEHSRALSRQIYQIS